MTASIKHSLVLGLLIFSSLAGFATHIVGGDFYYERLSSNSYLVTMKVYMDCKNGSPGAIESDATAFISFWNARTNAYIRQETFYRTGPKRLNKSNYSCAQPSANVCVDEYVYTKTVNINPGTDGVILAFQRCCRNNIIDNIVSPEATGATYWTKIPGSNVAAYNNSAIFKELPPNYLCTKAPLKFDHSATDADGDSLAYQLYQPFLGASKDQPRPDNGGSGNFKAPPFTNVQWKSPYSTSLQLNGDPGFQIDPITGELTVTPTKAGVYVIGIKVKEYRDGELIGETLRDYQMVVEDCQFEIYADFTPEVSYQSYVCTRTVNFVNKSYKATDFRWDFGDPATLADTSRDRTPTYVYPKDGDYKVTLTAWNTICTDEFELVIRIRSKINVNLPEDIYICDNSDVYITTTLWDATKIAWSNGRFGNTIKVNQPGEYTATAYYGNCFGSDTVHLIMDTISLTLPKDSIFCEVKDVDMIADAGVSGLRYRWNTSTTDTLQTLHITKPGLYWVRVRNDNCTAKDSLVVFISTKPKIGPFYFVCNEFEREFDAGDIPGATFLWSNGDTTRTSVLNSAGLRWVEVRQNHCVSRDTVLIMNPIINLELGKDSNYCDNLYRKLKAPPNMKSYLWSDQSTQSFLEVRQPGQYSVIVSDTNGCSKEDTINLTLSQSPSIFIGNDTTICVRSVAPLGIEENFVKYEWNIGERSKMIGTEVAGMFILTVTDSNGCKAVDTAIVSQDPDALPNDLFIPNAFSPNGDGLNEVFPFKDFVPQPEYRVRVFNRWGQKVFDSENGSQQWNATFDGQRVALGAYIYLIEFRACNGENKRVSGTITILE
ncbi:MAG: gliding motility-associated-like protein [Bacteroidia bacterium]